MNIGFARVSTTKQHLARQLDDLAAAGIEAQHIYVDEKSGTTTNRPGLQEAVRHTRAGDVIVVHTLDRFGRSVQALGTSSMFWG